jgi:1-acyl-sn-glycerol-3-phosphate acyltransferase
VWLNRLTVVCRPLYGFYWRLRLEGDTAAVPMSGPLIVAANHASFLDPWFVSALFPRPVHYLITRDWYDASAVWRFFFRANGTVPVEPKDPVATLRAVRRILDRGRVVGIFPEGRISKDGRVQRFRSGIAHIAAVTGVPVVPLGIRGAYDSLPRNRKLPRPRPVSLHVGPPIVFPGSPIDGDLELMAAKEFRDRLYRSVCELAGTEARRTIGSRRRTSEADHESDGSGSRSA